MNLLCSLHSVNRGLCNNAYTQRDTDTRSGPRNVQCFANVIHSTSQARPRPDHIYQAMSDFHKSTFSRPLEQQQVVVFSTVSYHFLFTTLRRVYISWTCSCGPCEKKKPLAAAGKLKITRNICLMRTKAPHAWSLPHRTTQ